jgi:hypothetical protein
MVSKAGYHFDRVLSKCLELVFSVRRCGTKQALPAKQVNVVGRDEH